ncbi:hypothetical protein Rsub_05483 [Raphidocelis subcapitata]|uniref:Uncharacterized protein n=1 Tax=Raphidocelis subcapitata TaxID=307507 RepID=A0A2V0NZ03_9CHLO|nr:hypothetical protein Rsub_05483 [Raphidocelis subcapitata]|eukprot:GBF92864.1 hypothetical protein Rsub_05483 [Raphidocelis subcapitata]
MLALQKQQIRARAPAAGPRRLRVARVVAQQQAEEPKIVDRVKQVALAGAVASALLLGSGVVAPDEAFAARSGGRVSSSGFSSRRAAAPRAAPRTRATVNNYSTTVVAPPLVGGYGFGMPFFGGYGFGPSLFMPMPFMGGILQFMIVLFMINVVFSVVKGAVNAANKPGGKSDDDWDSL